MAAKGEKSPEPEPLQEPAVVPEETKEAEAEPVQQIQEVSTPEP